MIPVLFIENTKTKLQAFRQKIGLTRRCSIIRQTDQTSAAGLKRLDNIIASNVQCSIKSDETLITNGQIIVSPVRFKLLLEPDQEIRIGDIIVVDSRRYRTIELHEHQSEITRQIICEEIPS